MAERPKNIGRSSRIGFWAGILLSCACARTAVVESAAVVPGQGRLLEPPALQRRALQPEVLHANIELFGISLATLESARCPATQAQPATIQTRVTPAKLVKVIRRTSGDARTEFAPEAVVPVSSDYNMRDGDLFRHYRVEHGGGSFAYSYDNGGDLSRRGRDAVPENASAHDLHSAMMLMRSWRPRLNEEAYFYVVLGRRLWRVDVRAAGPEVIKSDGVPQLTHRIDGVGVRLWRPSEAAPRHFSLWLSEGAERVPVRMVADASFGEVTMELTEREEQATSCDGARVAASEPTAAAPAPSRIGAAWFRP